MNIIPITALYPYENILKCSILLQAAFDVVQFDCLRVCEEDVIVKKKLELSLSFILTNSL